MIEWLNDNLPLAVGRQQRSVLRKYLNGDIRSVLDVGCGKGYRSIYRRFDSTGIDIWESFLDKARERGNYKRLIKIDVRDLCFPCKSFDAVTCLEVIEHLDKEDGVKLLDALDKIARKRIIITTPWGYDLSPKASYNPYLKHLSGWFPEDFKSRGYKIVPIISFRMEVGIKLYLHIVEYALSVLLSPLIVLFPDKFCYDFAAVKEL